MGPSATPEPGAPVLTTPGFTHRLRDDCQVHRGLDSEVMIEQEPTNSDDSGGTPDKPEGRSVPRAFPSPPSDPWILRRLIACRKTPQGNLSGNWSQDPIPVRFGPYVKPRPAGRLTEWRAVRAAAGSHIFILLRMAQTAREDFRAWLVLDEGPRRSVIERWEYHGGHAPDGMHSQSWCGGRTLPMDRRPSTHPAACLVRATVTAEITCIGRGRRSGLLPATASRSRCPR